jgi:hypothetical protein
MNRKTLAQKSSWLLRGAAVIALALPAAVMLGPAGSEASVSPSSALFAAQAKAAHLSVSQQATLQSEVDRIIARYGGHQVGLNEIALPHYSSILFPLPGQRVARVLPGTPPLPVNKAKIAQAKRAAKAAGRSASWSPGQAWPAPSGASCPYYYFCSWQGYAYTGIQFNVSWCNVWQEYPGSGWDNIGSYANNQTFNTEAYLANASEQKTDTLGGSDPVNGPNVTPVMDWEPYWYVMACQD